MTDGAPKTTIFEFMSALARETGAINLGQGFPDREHAPELLAAAQGCDFHGELRSSTALEAVRAVVRAHVPTLKDVRYFHPDLEAAAALVQEALIANVRENVSAIVVAIQAT